MITKPVKESIAFYALNQAGDFLCVKRAEDSNTFPGLWGLASASKRVGESDEAAIMRAARDKLGITVRIERRTGEGYADRGEYGSHLSEYEVVIIEGTPTPHDTDPTTNHYSAVQWSDDPELLRHAAEQGSLCSRIFLRNRGLWSDDKA